MIFEEESQ